jgi:hypothetical protein
MFNPHGNRTANGVVITEGLEVFTNELRVGKVVADERNDGMCCVKQGADPETHGNSGQIRLSQGWFSDHPTANKLVELGCHCRHDHWFTVETANGTVSMNGERLATFFEGRRAEDEITW